MCIFEQKELENKDNLSAHDSYTKKQRYWVPSN